MSEKKHPILSFFLKLSFLIFIFFLGFSLAHYVFEEGIIITGEKVGVIEIKGLIKSSNPTLNNLIKLGENKHIKAIVLRIDSPGGTVGPSQEIYLEIMRLRRKKPIVASLGSVAASGSYYIASAANKIVASPGTITGSIGVKMEFLNIQQLLNKLGLEPVVIKSGIFKDIGSPTRKMSKEERMLLERVIKDVHTQFVEAIAKGRGLPLDKVEEIADGRIFTGRRAKELGLVDRLGNLQDAIMLAAKLGGIRGKPGTFFLKRKESIWEMFFSSLFEFLSKNEKILKFE
ncbi:MAG: signal peptide peptidase SppA [Deltaproteobacteria bacterium]|nr:signal peptide peptidase SppA [Deltaproteobacteria bacterium]